MTCQVYYCPLQVAETRLDDEIAGYFGSPEDAPAKWVLMLRAYIDESGHESKGWTILAGYLGREEQWKAFVPKWREVLGPQRKFLHMKSLRWKKDSTRYLLKRLSPIPEACGLVGCVGGVRYQDYEDLVTGTPDEKLIRGYVVCLYAMVIQVLRGTPKDERIEFVFEEQRQYEPLVNVILPIIGTLPLHSSDKAWKTTSDGRLRLAKWGFVPKGSTLMTDPADYLAFGLREAWTDSKSKKAQWCKPILTAGSGEGYGSIMKRATIRTIINNAENEAIWLTVRQRLQGLL